ncbi:hypothetical protein BDP27DRAFT_79642 [Rhodocollybia butyracea]|uniref:DUF8212 domain-containing protein n=1 Tax=Rhodocollybia butyracea TaxID=206335 RepID=A0A9P5U2W0_9AGAR|nr:hypothetical protein BDP27DRAFT_79642 [Rhodocollybia butyracea]
MYRYYHEAEVCYAYLADMQSDFFNLGFRMCKWFTRGWTLQELIAPKTVVFFAKGWEKIGTKASLSGILTEITGIASEVLLSTADSSEMSIAARMSWAAGRKTTRIEDRAYSLMGIFGVFMSPIYGEGEHAFIRLQEEILKVSDDQTIFAWKDKLSVGSYSGILATSPDVFEESGKFQRLDNPYDLDNQRPFSLTNMGLLVHLPLSHVDLTIQTEKRNQVAVLNCGWAGTSDRLAI